METNCACPQHIGAAGVASVITPLNVTFNGKPVMLLSAGLRNRIESVISLHGFSGGCPYDLLITRTSAGYEVNIIEKSWWSRLRRTAVKAFRKIFCKEE